MSLKHKLNIMEGRFKDVFDILKNYIKKINR